MAETLSDHSTQTRQQQKLVGDESQAHGNELEDSANTPTQVRRRIRWMPGLLRASANDNQGMCTKSRQSHMDC